MVISERPPFLRPTADGPRGGACHGAAMSVFEIRVFQKLLLFPRWVGPSMSRRRYPDRPARVLVRYGARHSPSVRPAAVAAGRLADGQSYREER